MSQSPFFRLVVIAAIIVSGVAPSHAQGACRTGDVIIGAVSNASQQASILGITRQGAVYTLVPQMPFLPYGIVPAPDNRSLLAAGAGLARIAPDGTVTSLSLGPSLDLIGLDVDGSGNLILTQPSASSMQPAVLKFTRGMLSTLYAWPQVGACVGAEIDLRSGDLILSGQPQGGPIQIMRATLHGTPSVSTVNVLDPAPCLPGYYAFPRHDPETDTHLLMRSLARIESFTVRAPGTSMTTLFQGPPLGGWVMSPGRDPGDGSFVIPTFDLASPLPPSLVLRFDATNRAFRTLASFTAYSASAAVVAGSRHLCGLNEVWPGQSFAMLVSSPAEPGAAYAVALGLDYFPGFCLPDGRKVHLNPDALFFWSLGNAWPFSGFRGVLDARGEALATVAIPNVHALCGFRFFAAAVTIVKSRISVISEPLGVTIQ